MEEKSIENVKFDSFFKRLEKNRNSFHIKIFKILIEKGELVQDDVEESASLGKFISEYIDDTRNGFVRELIENNKLDEAATIVVAKIKERKNQQQAA